MEMEERRTMGRMMRRSRMSKRKTRTGMRRTGTGRWKMALTK
jgi:hypothetical protein